MTVKRKVSSTVEAHGRIELSSHLARVREAITQLPPEENEMETATETPSTPSTVKKIVKKPGANRAKKVAKKPAAPAKKTDNAITLAEVCKGIKMEPRRARRILREAKVKNPGRWTWTKGSGDHKRVEKLLKDADAE